MDRWLLGLINQQWTNPLLDGMMVGVSTMGLVALPLLGVGLQRWGEEPRTRQIGKTLLLALVASLAFTLLFYYLALRPRPALLWPTEIRLLLPTPRLPAFPSGHTAAAFATATVLLLGARRGWITTVATVGALLMGYSRVYLGHHYPSDLLAGAVLGAGVGAAAHGLLLVRGSLAQRLRWLLWLQIALVVVMTQMAYLNVLPVALLQWPFADKVIHALFFGAVTFWLNLWWPERWVRMGRWALPLAIVAPFTLALLEEGIQHFSPLRTGDPVDLAADLVGMVGFWWLSRRFVGERG